MEGSLLGGGGGEGTGEGWQCKGLRDKLETSEGGDKVQGIKLIRPGDGRADGREGGKDC